MAAAFSSPEPVVSWSRGRLQIKPSDSGDEKDAGNTKIWAKIISAYAKKCSITGFSSLRGGGGAKNAIQVYMPSRGMNA